jgi:sugar phosphate isomerase/epimerase
LGFGTVIDADYLGLLDSAAAIGVPEVTLNPALYLDARDRGSTDKQLRAELEARGLRVALVDPLISPFPALPPLKGLTDYLQRWFTVTEEQCFAIADSLGAPLLTVVHPLGGFVERNVMIDVIGGIAARAAPHGLGIALEFSPTSRALDNLSTALDIVACIGTPNVGVVFDTWHFYRSGGEVADLAAVPPSAIMNFQVNDAPAEAKNTVQPVLLTDRLLPGDGDIPLREIFEAVLTGRPDLGITVEVFSSSLRSLPPAAAAQRALDATRRVMNS